MCQGHVKASCILFLTSGLCQALAAAARTDKEEWVGVIGRAVGDFSGVLDLEAVLETSTAVRLSFPFATCRPCLKRCCCAPFPMCLHLRPAPFNV